MLINVCEMCGENKKTVPHHTIPRFLNGEERDVISICNKCHCKTDWIFKRFLLNPFNNNSYGKKIRGHKQRFYNCKICKKYIKAYRHHIIPRFLGGGDDKDVILLCNKCHKTVDWKFMRLLFNPFNENYYGKRQFDKKREADRIYYQHHKDGIKSRARKYQRAHKEKKKKYNYEYYRNHKEEKREYDRKYRQKHKK